MCSMVRHVEFILVSALLICPFGTVAQECSRYSPEEIWFADYSPWLHKTVEEMKVYFQVLFAQLEGNIFDLMPHIRRDESQSRKLAQDVQLVREKLSANLESHYSEIERSWLQLCDVSRHYKENQTTAEHVIGRMQHLQQTHVRSNKSLDNALGETATIFTVLIEHVVEGVTQMLESELDVAPETDAATAELLRNRIFKLAPDDLLGKTVNRFIARRLEPNDYSRNKPAPVLFNEIIRSIDQMMVEFETLPVTLNSSEWETFWRTMFDRSVEHPAEDYRRIFSNEVYVVEILMNLIVYYSEH